MIKNAYYRNNPKQIDKIVKKLKIKGLLQKQKKEKRGSFVIGCSMQPSSSSFLMRSCDTPHCRGFSGCDGMNLAG
jgi:hypothetical protein